MLIHHTLHMLYVSGTHTHTLFSKLYWIVSAVVLETVVYTDDVSGCIIMKVIHEIYLKTY